MTEFDYNDYSAYDPGVDTEGITSADLAAVAQSAGEAGAARVMAELAQGQAQNQQFALDQQAGQTLAEAERALRAHDSSWDQKKMYAAQILTEHPSLLPPAALYDAEQAAEALWNAAEIGLATERQQQAAAKRADDEQAYQRIKAQAGKSWSARMTDAGATSVHDILDS